MRSVPARKIWGFSTWTIRLPILHGVRRTNTLSAYLLSNLYDHSTSTLQTYQWTDSQTDNLSVTILRFALCASRGKNRSYRMSYARPIRLRVPAVQCTVIMPIDSVDHVMSGTYSHRRVWGQLPPNLCCALPPKNLTGTFLAAIIYDMHSSSVSSC